MVIERFRMFIVHCNYYQTRLVFLNFARVSRVKLFLIKDNKEIVHLFDSTLRELTLLIKDNKEIVHLFNNTFI